jgi:hypothetical protein
MIWTAMPCPPNAAALMRPINIDSNVHMKVDAERSMTAGSDVFRTVMSGDFTDNAFSNLP